MANLKISSRLSSLIILLSLLSKTYLDLRNNFFCLPMIFIWNPDHPPSFLGKVKSIIGRIEKGFDHEWNLCLIQRFRDPVSLKSIFNRSCLYPSSHHSPLFNLLYNESRITQRLIF